MNSGMNKNPGTQYPAYDAQSNGTAELTPPPQGLPRVIGSQDKTVVRAPLSSFPNKPSPVQDFPPHFREDDLLNEPLLRGTDRMVYLGRMRPVLGGIPLLASLGRGGMGSVYYAVHPRLKLEVAVKVLSAEMAEKHGELIRRFQLEAQIAARVKSQNLVGVIDVNFDRGLHYLVMEYVHGVTADQMVKQNQSELPEAQVLDICAAACEGLATAHAAGVVHRDIKPANILIPFAQGNRDPRFKSAKVADLGIARIQDQVSGETQANTPMGSPGYMSPEQVVDSSNVMPASDVFGMGATMYAMLARRAPFVRTSYAASLIATIKEPSEPVRSVRPNVSPATSAMIARCLSKNPQERYADGAELLREIRICRASLTVSVPEQAEIADRIERDARLSCVNAPAVVDANRKLIVMSVEDNDTEQLYMKHLVKKLPWEMEFFQVNSPENAFDLLKRITPDIILTDICMPCMDGYEFIEKLRTLPAHKLTPVVVKSAITEDVGKNKSLHIGADAYLQKPIRFESLQQTIGRMITRIKNQVR